MTENRLRRGDDALHGCVRYDASSRSKQTMERHKVADMLSIGGQSLAQTNTVKALAEYEVARRKAKRQAWRARITRRPNALVSMDELTQALPVEGEHYAGLQQVPVRAIVGSVDRHRDFDGNFNPACEHTRQRWIRIANAHLHDTMLSPVQLIKIGSVYMVEDGNHRVSVARHFGVEYIDAEITEYVTVPSTTPLPLEHASRPRWDRLARLARAGMQATRARLLSRRTLEAAETY
jgi:hypothetical protein